MKPLSNVTVLDLTVNTPGPFCSMTLADLGARVIKVEPPVGDPLRVTSPAMWTSLNRGKESIVLDLKNNHGRQLLAKLASEADVVLEGWRPGVAVRLGADYPTLSAHNKGLVYCSISGFGQDGPWRDRSGHDLNYLALTGYLGVQAGIEGRPWPPAVLLSDLASGLYAAVMVLAAINGRNVSGKGAYLDLSMAETVLSLLGPELGEAAQGKDTGRGPNVSFIPTYGLFQCADGRWLSLGIVHEDRFWSRFCAIAGLDDLADLDFGRRLAQPQSLVQRLEAIFLSLPSAEWDRRLGDADIPAAVVLDLKESLNSTQFLSREAFVEVDGEKFVAPPVKFSTGSVSPEKVPPALAEHTDRILHEFGYSPDESTGLRDCGAFG